MPSACELAELSIQELRDRRIAQQEEDAVERRQRLVQELLEAQRQLAASTTPSQYIATPSISELYPYVSRPIPTLDSNLQPTAPTWVYESPQPITNVRGDTIRIRRPSEWLVNEAPLEPPINVPSRRPRVLARKIRELYPDIAFGSRQRGIFTPGRCYRTWTIYNIPGEPQFNTLALLKDFLDEFYKIKSRDTSNSFRRV